MIHIDNGNNKKFIPTFIPKIDFSGYYYYFSGYLICTDLWIGDDNDIFPTIYYIIPDNLQICGKNRKKKKWVSSVFLAPLPQSLEDPHCTRTKLRFMLFSSALILWKDESGSDMIGLFKKEKRKTSEWALLCRN